MRGFAVLAAALAVFIEAGATCAAAAPQRFDHIYLIVLENHDFEDAFTEQNTPFLSALAREQGFARQYFGVSHPSLPNYLAMIGGDTFGVDKDYASCFASDLKPGQSCRHVEGASLVDQFEAAGLDYALYSQSAPAAGALVQAFPDGEKAFYAQKHNPLVYFDRVAKSPARLAKLKPFDAFAADLSGKAANFVFIVPDQCHDGHGLRVFCQDEAQLQRDYDAFVRDAVTTIRNSPNWTENSVIVVTFDEGEFQHKTPQAAATENRIAAVVVTKCGGPATSDARFDHYALLATIEDGFGLPRLRNADKAPTMMDLFRRPCK